MKKKASFEISIGDVTYPARLTMGAMIGFKRRTGKDASQIKLDDIEETLTLMWCCIASACRADGKAFELSFEEFCDVITPLDVQDWNAQFAENAEKKTPSKETE